MQEVSCMGGKWPDLHQPNAHSVFSPSITLCTLECTSLSVPNDCAWKRAECLINEKSRLLWETFFEICIAWRQMVVSVSAWDIFHSCNHCCHHHHQHHILSFFSHLLCPLCKFHHHHYHHQHHEQPPHGHYIHIIMSKLCGGKIKLYFPSKFRYFFCFLLSVTICLGVQFVFSQYF